VRNGCGKEQLNVHPLAGAGIIFSEGIMGLSMKLGG
jgi:hypothetical protein